MRNYKSNISILFLLILIIVSCKKALDEFGTIDNMEEVRSEHYKNEVESLMKQLKDSAMTNPTIYASAFNHMNEFHNKSERLLAEMKYTRELIEGQVEDLSDYEKLDQNTDILFFNGDQYSDNGKRFLKAIQDYNISSSDQLFFFPYAEKRAKESFSLEDERILSGEKVDWFTYHFKGYPAIASITKIKLLEGDVKEVESIFLKTLIEEPQF